ncbi:CLIP domain-containing serine protease B9-like [Penaeus indicus]|uniref:CLIP domain-containing serine protease B9-like n=1 Tax=Penaeus indicus TaxID=29960 RepID=UPI00300C4235
MRGYTQLITIVGALTDHSKCPCGVSNGVRIVGGTEVSPAFRYPWLVVLFETPYLEEPFCGGAITNPRYVATAAHCLFSRRNEPKPATLLRVRVAEDDVASEEDDLEGVTRMLALQSYIVHEGFAEDHLSKDIALLHLDVAPGGPPRVPAAGPDEGLRRANREGARLGGDASNGRDEFPGIVREVDVCIVECGRRKIAGVWITPFMLCAEL